MPLWATILLLIHMQDHVDNVKFRKSLCYTSIETTEKSNYNSESMSTPNTKINHSVSREKEEENLGSNRNDEVLCSNV